jgi:uncharacterized membrane protein YcaP (DUF421 family)/DNA-directed RNA polymerase subunit RPC12/RpoP
MEGAYTFDLARILLGRLPWLYLAEILVRTTIVYFFALFVVRTIGKRGMGQLAPFDFVIIIALGSAVGDPMFYPDVPLLHALVAITAIVVLTQGVTRVTQRSKRIQDLLSATAARLIRDGVMDLAAMRQEGIARTELFEALRTIGIEHLGEVERAYLEPSGKISVFRQPQDSVCPGLPILPEGVEGPLRSHHSGETVLVGASYACWECGHTINLTSGNPYPACAICQENRWTRAVRSVHEALGLVSRAE